MAIGMSFPTEPVTITYIYDALHRLTAADYSDGKYYHYTYDSVGNRLTQATSLAASTYSYDDANRLTSVDGVDYTWDANGNLLNDGENAYAYDSANRLTAVSGQQ
jgi:YD repeat-containing protein